MNKDIEVLQTIWQDMTDNYFDNTWKLSDSQQEELYRITGIEEHDWDDDKLAHYIDGMRTGINIIKKELIYFWYTQQKANKEEYYRFVLEELNKIGE